MNLRQPFSGDYPITLDYGEVWEPVYIKDHPHKGIDYGCPWGTPVLAAADGRAIRVGYEPDGYGNYILLYHRDGSGTVYAHLQGTAVCLNEEVKKGGLVGMSGNTGKSSGPHLHFEYRTEALKSSTAADPKPLMQSVYDSNPVQGPVQSPVQGAQTAADGQFPQLIDGGLCEVICPAANVRDAESFLVKGTLNMGTKLVVSVDVVRFNGLPYHKIMDDYLLIAEYDAYGTQILRQIDR